MENDYAVRTESDKRRSSCFDQCKYVSVALGARIRAIPGTREREGESTERVIAARALSPSSSLCWTGQGVRETHVDSESVAVTLALANGGR